MDAKLAIDALRTGLGLISLVRNFTQTASADQLKEFVAGIHAAGGTIDMQVVDKAADDLNATIENVQAKINAKG